LDLFGCLLVDGLGVDNVLISVSFVTSASGRLNVIFCPPIIIIVRYNWLHRAVGELSVFLGTGEWRGHLGHQGWPDNQEVTCATKLYEHAYRILASWGMWVVLHLWVPSSLEEGGIILGTSQTSKKKEKKGTSEQHLVPKVRFFTRAGHWEVLGPS
jgi:hypothetical protein